MSLILRDELTDYCESVNSINIKREKLSNKISYEITKSFDKYSTVKVDPIEIKDSINYTKDKVFVDVPNCKFTFKQFEYLKNNLSIDKFEFQLVGNYKMRIIFHLGDE